MNEDGHQGFGAIATVADKQAVATQIRAVIGAGATGVWAGILTRR
jgi:hypothetical protein